MQVLCIHFVFFNTWGISNSFSVYQQICSAMFPQSPSKISWIGSVQVCFLFFAVVVAGRATDTGYFRHAYVSEVFLQLLGIFVLSLSKIYWQVFLAQSVCMGLGNGLTFTPGLSVISSYFENNRGFAVGLSAAGAATGGLIYPVAVNQLLYHNGVSVGWTTRAIGLIMVITHLPGYSPSNPVCHLVPCSNFWGLYFAFFYIGTFARDRIGIKDTQDLVLVLNGVWVVGRVLPTVIGDRVTGRLSILIPCSLASSVIIYCWIPVPTAGGLYAFAAVYGVVGGAAQALFPAAITTLNPDSKQTGTRVGMILSIMGIATLTGPAIEGALIQRGNGTVAARVAKAGWRLNVKA
ncbi:major facilitator superfamily domain-containing protein [Aspergillus avenaceus]|uniref:Major facilitator superfamily domain-containing protein n=1 Tax=Aspergillus avenaceus TaxID=36643 RepID=A0A5N6U1C8_ASPAV|nr:major facilitator superfamily domain-containing protein [Aspergillus avenaceus]